MDQWKWNLAQAGGFFVGALLFSLVVASVGVSWWVVLVIPAAFLPAARLLVQAVRERRRGRHASESEPRP